MTMLLAFHLDLAPVATAALFYLFAGITGASALFVAISRNIVRTAVGLLFTLVGVSGLYFLLDAEFLAAVQLVVYAGGTLILIIFGVMLTSKSPFSKFEPRSAEVMVAVAISVLLLVTLLVGIGRLPANSSQRSGAAPAAAVGSTQPAPATPTSSYSTELLGRALLGDYLVPFELSSVLLLVVMIGAAYLAKGRRRDPDDDIPMTRAGVPLPTTGTEGNP
jgi:NADH-quinone oxidoreductase subunit J